MESTGRRRPHLWLGSKQATEKTREKQFIHHLLPRLPQRGGSCHRYIEPETPAPDTRIMTMRQSWIPGGTWGCACAGGGGGVESETRMEPCGRP